MDTITQERVTGIPIKVMSEASPTKITATVTSVDTIAMSINR